MRLPTLGVRRRKMPRSKFELARRMRDLPTKAEGKLWEILKGKALGARFRRQAPMWGYIADFYVPSLRLCIEVDGGYHDANIDQKRDGILSKHGITTLRFTNNEVLNKTDLVISNITKAISLAAS